MLHRANKEFPSFPSNRVVGNYAGDGPMFGAGVTLLSTLRRLDLARSLAGVVVCDRVAIGNAMRKVCDRVSNASNKVAGRGAARQKITPTPLWVLPGSRAYTGAEGDLRATVPYFFLTFCFSFGFGNARITL